MFEPQASQSAEAARQCHIVQVPRSGPRGNSAALGCYYGKSRGRAIRPTSYTGRAERCRPRSRPRALLHAISSHEPPIPPRISPHRLYIQGDKTIHTNSCPALETFHVPLSARRVLKHSWRVESQPGVCLRTRSTRRNIPWYGTSGEPKQNTAPATGRDPS